MLQNLFLSLIYSHKNVLDHFCEFPSQIKPEMTPKKTRASLMLATDESKMPHVLRLMKLKAIAKVDA